MVDKLGKLIREINSHFKVNDNVKFSIKMWDLTCWKNGFWSIDVIDDWHEWCNKGIRLPNSTYSTPEMACKEFIKFIKKNKINIKKLQSK